MRFNLQSPEQKPHSPGWLGYLATLVGAVVGFIVAYIAVGRGLAPLETRAFYDGLGPQHAAALKTFYIAFFAGLVVTCLVSAASAYVFSRLARSGAELETAVLAAPGMLAAIYLVYQKQWWAAYVPLLFTALLMSRWLGVRWHAWRTRAQAPVSMT